MKHEVTFHIDTRNLATYTDEHLAALWHIAQANPAPITDHEPGELAEHIGREIIRRWLRWAGAPLWNHQGRHFYSAEMAASKESAVAGDSSPAQGSNSSEVQ
ncbi:hypothetical protein [Cupriavidus plantarum]|uniref:hypothetical protein n=1 Tax=Cupriavidus plantarum TaxID=942865 RepID=UPI000E366468|nr:hypothetical protein [Cupriavidus plantarum]REE92616.1 hypothetical protein C7418_3885 [Cupriavidus plantarum]